MKQGKYTMTSSIFSRLVLFFALLFSVSCSHATPDNCDIQKGPIELPKVVQNLHTYYTSGAYTKDVTTQVQEALKRLEQAIAKYPGNQNLALVSDIDDTVLSSEPASYSIKYGFYLPHFSEEINKASFPEIAPMHALMDFAKAHHITVFFVTGRYPSMQQATEKNLKQQGFDYWKMIYYKPADYKESSVVGFKSSTRSLIESQGFIVLLTIGDQESDLSGGHAEHTIKLPNYMYYIP
jgi:predicted secreted acid phosphatase